MGFKSGAEWNGNRNGVPRKPEIQLFREAIAKVEAERGTSLLVHAVNQAFDDKMVLVALLKKILPDMTTSEITGFKDVLDAIIIKYNQPPKLQAPPAIPQHQIEEYQDQDQDKPKC